MDTPSKPKPILVEISGGVLVGVHTKDPASVRVLGVDWDQVKEGEPAYELDAESWKNIEPFVPIDMDILCPTLL